MQRVLIGLMMTAGLVTAQDVQSSSGFRQWTYSAAFLSTAAAADVVSSRGLVESNPVLGRGEFGSRQAGVKLGIIGGVLLGEWLVLRKHPSVSKAFRIANYLSGSLTFGAAIHNEVVR